jgi:hypothetical protein
LISKILASKSILRRDDDFTTNDAGRRLKRQLGRHLYKFDAKRATPSR